MNKTRYLGASLAVFVFIFIYEWAFHGNFLKGMYMQTQHLWRPPNECVWPAMLGGQIFFSFMFTLIFLKGYENKGMGEGLRYGVLIGLLFIPTNLIFYAVQPLPYALVAAWCVGGMLEMILAGMIAATVYRP